MRHWCVSSKLLSTALADNDASLRLWADERAVPVYGTLVSAALLSVHGIIASGALKHARARTLGYDTLEEEFADESSKHQKRGVRAIVEAHGGWTRFVLLLVEASANVALLVLSVVELAKGLRMEFGLAMLFVYVRRFSLLFWSIVPQIYL
jgi:hypothetical protein